MTSDSAGIEDLKGFGETQRGKVTVLRLSTRQKAALFEALEEAALPPGSEVYLFGSRTDAAAKGGDVDVLVLTREGDAHEIEWALRRAYRRRLDERIDVLVADPDDVDTERQAFIDTLTKVRIK